MKLGLKLKRNSSRIRIQSVKMTKIIYWIQHTKKNRNIKNGDKNVKALYKLMNNTVYRETMKNLRNKKRLFKMYIKTKLYVAQNIW